LHHRYPHLPALNVARHSDAVTTRKLAQASVLFQQLNPPVVARRDRAMREPPTPIGRRIISAVAEGLPDAPRSIDPNPSWAALYQNRVVVVPVSVPMMSVTVAGSLVLLRLGSAEACKV
jgi:hypothetical protein